jgi:hypothetical protein
VVVGLTALALVISLFGISVLMGVGEGQQYDRSVAAVSIFAVLAGIFMDAATLAIVAMSALSVISLSALGPAASCCRLVTFALTSESLPGAG